jgi:hypothetical protein
MVSSIRPILVAALVVGCGKLDDPNVVIDLRILGAVADAPEQVLDLDPRHPPTPVDLLAQVRPTTICALLADPAQDRALRVAMVACSKTTDLRCDSDHPQLAFASVVIADPDTAPEPAPGINPACATLAPDGDLLGVLVDALQRDPLSGFGGLDYEIELAVGPVDGEPEAFASKTLRLSPRITPTQTANHNPTLDHVEVSIDGGAPRPLPLGRCVEQVAPLVVSAGRKARLTPVEAAGARESYVVPTYSGGVETFTESLSYQWTATVGGFSKGTTGGVRDVYGNTPPLFTDWKAPSVQAATDVPLWIVQRDERLGAAWYASCLRVVP